MAEKEVFIEPASPTENLLYNPAFSNNAELWETRGASQTIESVDDHTTFTLNRAGGEHMGAVQSLDLGLEQTYTLSVELRVTGVEGEDPFVIIGSVQPGGAMVPGTPIYRVGTDFPLNTWVTLSAPQYGPVTPGFTTYDITQLDVRYASLLPSREDIGQPAPKKTLHRSYKKLA